MPIGVAGVRFCESAPTGFDRPLEISPLEAISGPPFSGRNPGTEYGPTLLGPRIRHVRDRSKGRVIPNWAEGVNQRSTPRPKTGP